MLSPHFAVSEAGCHDGTDLPDQYHANAVRLATTVLEPLRERYHGPLVAVSWYRSAYWNFAVGGAKSSQHLTASAADIRPADIGGLPRLRQCVEAMLAAGELPDLGGWGWYPSRWVHVDIRPRGPGGHVAHWIGQGVGSES